MRVLGTLLVFCAAGWLPECLPAKINTPNPNTIRVDIGGLRNDKGQVFCALYQSVDGFPKNTDKAVAKASSAIVEKKAVCEFSGFEAGTYALSVFHDENSNGKLDSNFVGIPREGVGASNGARGHFGPPKFDDASFHFSVGQPEGAPVLLPLRPRYGSPTGLHGPG